MYQIEVKRWLIAHCFSPIDGWQVRVDIDAMERARGGQHKPDKKARAKAAENALVEIGVSIGPNREHGRADIFARHPQHGNYIIEVEGASSRQKEQAVYSALGQLVMQMDGGRYSFVLAVPDDESWENQLRKIPVHVKKTLSLSCFLVSEHGIRKI